MHTQTDRSLALGAGVDLVVHCAGVMNFAPVDPFADMLKPVVLGTLSLLTACKAAKSVERVVVMSATAAIHDVPDSNKVRLVCSLTNSDRCGASRYTMNRTGTKSQSSTPTATRSPKCKCILLIRVVY